MFALDWLMRSAHILAGTAWVGGSIMYLIVVLPVLRLGNAAPHMSMAIAVNFQRLTKLCMGVLLLSGGYLVFERLTTTTLGWSYLLVLVLKIVTALAMFALAFYLGQSKVRKLAKQATRFSQAAPRLMVALGILVFALGALLNLLFEMALAPK
jgi:putative copper export protein